MNRLLSLARRYGFDVLVVLGAAESAIQVAATHDAHDAPHTAVWLMVTAPPLVVLPLLGRRWFPLAAPLSLWILAGALSFVDGRLVVFTTVPEVAGMAAAFLLGNLADSMRARFGLAVVLVGAAVIVYHEPNHTSGTLFFIPLLFALGWLGGFAVRERAEQAEAAELRAAQAEREREAAARIAVAEERARIARELHDIVAHAVSVMVLQVGAVRHKLPGALAEDADALRGVEQTGRTALAEMRRLLGAMRRDGDEIELAPHPGLDRLDSLLDEVGRAGLSVRLHVEGEPVRLPAAVDLSAYRIIQEGLTNALKHAHAEHAVVTLRYGARELQIDVRDDGRGASPDGDPGFGLVGIRERVKIYGGEMTAHTAPDGGFVLSTRLPVSA